VGKPQKEKTMKKLLVAAIAIVSLAGCAVEDTGSSNSSNNNNNNNNSYTPPAQNKVKSNQEIYVELIRDEYGLYNMSDYELINFGKNLCTSIDDGLTVPGLALLALEYGVDVEMLGFISGGAIATFCPRHSDFFDGY
jgi:hypothetical protein